MRKSIALTAALVLCACEHVPALPDVRDETPQDIPAFFDCLREKSVAIVAAHRGGDAPAENAIETFARTVRGAPGPVMLEMDVRRTRDGGLVLMHDETVDRTTTGKGAVSGLTLEGFLKLGLKDDAGDKLGLHPTTLKRALEWTRSKAMLELDVKQGTPFEEVIAAVREAKAENRVVIIVYNTKDALTVHRLAPDLMISVPADSVGELEVMSSVRVDMRRILAWTGTREADGMLNSALAAKGIETIFGTLGDPATSIDARFAREGDGGYAALADNGVQVIATDRPLEAMRALDDMDNSETSAKVCLGAKSK